MIRRERKAKAAAAGRVRGALALFAAGILLSVSSCEAFRFLFDQSPPGIPENLVASKSTSTEYIGLAWDEPDYADSYRIYRGPDVWSGESFDEANLVFIGSAETTEYFDRDVEPDVNYWYKVSALNPHGTEGPRSPYLAYGSRRGSGGDAPIPYQLVAGKAGYNGVVLSCKTEDTVPWIMYWRATSLDGEKEPLGWVRPGGNVDLGPVTNVNGAQRGVLYYYWVQSMSVDGNSASALSLPSSGYAWGGSLSAPKNISASALASGGISLSWTQADGADTYTIYRGTSADGSDKGAIHSPPRFVGTSYLDPASNLVSGNAYYYWIYAHANTEYGTVLSDLVGPAQARAP